MKTTGLAIGLAVLGALGGVMAVTNPSQASYEDYAVSRLVLYLQESVCADLPTLLGDSLQQQCNSLVNSSQPQLKQLVTSGTQRQNLVLVSIYKTELAPHTLLPFLPKDSLPAYHFETVGALQAFHTYKSENQSHGGH